MNKAQREFGSEPINPHSPYNVFRACETVAQLKREYNNRKGTATNIDTLKKHYFQNMQRLLLGVVMVEDLPSDRRGNSLAAEKRRVSAYKRLMSA